jgi:alcohol dehydrogenase
MDVIVNFTGGDTWVPSIKALKVGGRMLTCGASAGFEPKTDIRYIWRREISIIGCNSWQREDLVDMLALVQAKKVLPPIHQVYPLAETKQAFRALKDREVFGKVIVEP